MQISKRLQAVSDMVTSCDCLADVGTDHGYIPISLVRRGIAARAVAMDVNQGPLNRAKENIEANGLSERIETRLSDGLSALAPGEAQTIVIAGMGGPLAVEILKKGSRVLKECQSLVLQPQSEIWNVRRYLDENGWRIQREAMVQEEGKRYTVILAVPGQKEGLDETQLLYGPRLLEQKDPLLHRFLEEEKEKRGRLLEGMPKEGSERTNARRKELLHLLERNEGARKRMEREEEKRRN